jgi:hypothetical protein
MYERRSRVVLPGSRALRAGLLLAGLAPLGFAAVPAPAGAGTPLRVSVEPVAHVWVFMGHPGDAEHLTCYGELVTRLTRVLGERFGIAEKQMTVLFAAGDKPPWLPCTKENLLAELDRVRALAAAGKHAWIFFLGHANSDRAGVRYNVPGPDPALGEIAEHLRDGGTEMALVIFLTTAAAGKFLQELAAPGRILVAATEPQQPDNETEFPQALVQTLEDAAADLDRDGSVTLLEIFRETSRRVRELYTKEGFVATEQAVLDGDGDGRGTAMPAQKDALPAQTVKLKARRR